MYVCLPAANIYDKQSRVCSHRFTPTSREELRKLIQLVPRLRELGVALVVCSDLDAQSGDALARRLNVPYEEWVCLRRFNAGKLHGVPKQKFESCRSQLQDETVPIKGGDSKCSFNKRISAAQQRLASIKQNLLVVLEEEVLVALVGSGNIERYHIYSMETPCTTNTNSAKKNSTSLTFSAGMA